MNNIKVVNREKTSMCDTPTQLLDFMSHIKYIDFDTLKSTLEVFLTCSGSCHDQTMFEMQELYGMGYDPKAWFILGVDKDGKGLESHSFVTYENENHNFCWFENAWADMHGIHEFSGPHSLKKAVIKEFEKRCDFYKVYIADFDPSEHTIGENLATLVNTCMETAQAF